MNIIYHDIFYIYCITYIIKFIPEDLKGGTHEGRYIWDFISGAFI